MLFTDAFIYLKILTKKMKIRYTLKNELPLIKQCYLQPETCPVLDTERSPRSLSLGLKEKKKSPLCGLARLPAILAPGG